MDTHGFPDVPNVPCGVERFAHPKNTPCLVSVPNVPCGVERNTKSILWWWKKEFLMYRVELKEAHLVRVRFV